MIQKSCISAILALAIFLLSGCLDSSLTFKLRFDETSGLQQGRPLFFEQNKVGQVTHITYTEKGDYLVEVNIAKEFKNSVTVDSQFFIGPNPVTTKDMAIIIVQEKPGGAVLEQNSIIEGSVKTGLLEGLVRNFTQNSETAADEVSETVKQLTQSLTEVSKQLDTELEHALENLSGKIESFSRELQEVPDSEEVKELENSIKEFKEGFDKAQKDVRDHIRNEVLPQLQKELDSLRQLLKREGREQEIEVIDHQVTEMTQV